MPGGHRTQKWVEADAVRRQLQGLLRTGCDTTLTANALALLVEYLGLWRPTLGVVAPHTAQGTPLHEDGCADAWAVVDGIALDVEYQRFHILQSLTYHSISDIRVPHSPSVQ